MDAATFHEVFASFSDPVFFFDSEQWHQNPAAQELNCSPLELKALRAITQEVSLWFHSGFYRVNPTQAGRGVYYTLHPDTFLTGPGAVLSSQIRLPLSSALFSLQNIAGRLNDPAALSEHLADMNQSLHRIFCIVDQLAMTLIPDELFLNTEDLDLSAFLTAFEQDVRALMEGLNVTFRLELPPQPIIICADEELLRYLLLSLLSNSLKFRPIDEEGKIVLSLKAVGKDQVMLTFSDNCSGLSPDILSYPLWNQPQNLTPHRGIGLGLPIAQRIAAAHGGSLKIDSHEGSSQVVVSLPANAPNLLFQSSGTGKYSRHDGFSDDLLLLADALTNRPYAPQPFLTLQ